MRISITIFSEDGENYNQSDINYTFINDPIDPENLDLIYTFIEMLYNSYGDITSQEETFISNEEYETLEKNYNSIECPICLVKTRDNIKLECGHIYCNSCSYKWFKTENKKTCPTCRKKIF